MSNLSQLVLPVLNESSGEILDQTFDINSGGGSSEVRLQKTFTLSTSSNTTLTFTDSSINNQSIIDVYTSVYGVNPSSVETSDGVCTVTFPKAKEATMVKCVLCIRGEIEKFPIYGVSWDAGTATTFTRTDDAVGLGAPNPYYAGMADTPESPFDNIYPWKDIKRVTLTAGVTGEYVEIPKYYYKISIGTSSPYTMKIQVSADYFDGSTVSPAHADRGDGKGERDKIYVSRYAAVKSGSYITSTSGNVRAMNSLSGFRSDANTIRTNFNQNVYPWDFAAYMTILILYLVEYADFDAQSRIGFGKDTTTTTGDTDSMPYHSGTVASSRDAQGSIQYRYIEGFWGNTGSDLQYVDGIYFNSQYLYSTNNPSKYTSTNPPSTAWTNIGYVPPGSGAITRFFQPSAATRNQYIIMPYEYTNTGIPSRGTTDYCNFNDTTYGYYFTVGKASDTDKSGGPFAWNIDSTAYSNYTTHLMILP